LTDWHLLEPLQEPLEGVTQMVVELVVPNNPTFTVTLCCPFPLNVISGAPVVYQL